MPESLTDLMAAGDPMLTPASQDMGAPMGPPPPMNTTREQPPDHQQLQQMMQQQPVSQLLPTDPAAPVAPTRKRAVGSELPDDVKDAFVVAMVAFLVLVPNIQSILKDKLAFTQNATMATLVNSLLIAAAFYFLKEHVVGLL